MCRFGNGKQRWIGVNLRRNRDVALASNLVYPVVVVVPSCRLRGHGASIAGARADMSTKLKVGYPLELPYEIALCGHIMYK